MTSDNKEYLHALPPGTLLNGTHADQYELLKVLGDGGFGITYQAQDRILGQAVAIKEFFPMELAVRDRDGVSVNFRSAKVREVFELARISHT